MGRPGLRLILVLQCPRYKVAVVLNGCQLFLVYSGGFQQVTLPMDFLHNVVGLSVPNLS